MIKKNKWIIRLGGIGWHATATRAASFQSFSGD